MKKYRKRLKFESLENRELLSADPFLTEANPQESNSSRADSPLRFEANLGQFAAETDFGSVTREYSMLLDNGHATLVLPNQEDGSSTRIGMHLVDANTGRLAGSEEARLSGRLDGHSNYYQSSNSDDWVTGVRHFRKAHFANVFRGVDVQYYGTQSKHFEFDFVVDAFADTSQIGIRFSGASDIRIAGNGDLVLKTAAGELRQKAPYAYQVIAGQKHEVTSSFQLADDGLVTFELGNYDVSRKLIIDPVITHSGRLGGSESDAAVDVSFDSDGNMIIVGMTQSPDFSPGGLVEGRRGDKDVFITKYDSSGTRVLYSTIVGGRYDDTVNDLVVDSQGNAVITGTSLLGQIPTLNGFQNQPSHHNLNYVGEEGYVLRLSGEGRLNYSSLVGGYGASSSVYIDDYGKAVTVDEFDNVYLVGDTNSHSGLNAKNYHDSTRVKNQRTDIFLAKVDMSRHGSDSLRYLGFLGTSDREKAEGIEYRDGSVYIVGNWHSTSSNSQTFKGTAGTFQPNRPQFDTNGYSRAQHGIILKVNASEGAAGQIQWKSFLAGSRNDTLHDVATDSDGNVFVVGKTESDDFHGTGGTPATLRAGTVTKISADGRMATTRLIDNSGYQSITAIDIDRHDNVFVAVEGFDSTFDTAVHVLNTDLETVVAQSTHSTGMKRVSGLDADDSGIVVVAGENPLQKSDAALAKIDFTDSVDTDPVDPQQDVDLVVTQFRVLDGDETKRIYWSGFHQVPYEFTVKNNGTTDIAEWEVDVVLSDQPLTLRSQILRQGSLETVVQYRFNEVLKAGESVTIQGRFSLRSGYKGTLHAGTVVDPEGKISEGSGSFANKLVAERNNQRQGLGIDSDDFLSTRPLFQIPNSADLAASQIQVSNRNLVAGETFRIRSSLENLGGERARSFRVAAYLSHDGLIQTNEDRFLGHVWISAGMNEGESAELEIVARMPGMEHSFLSGAGSYTIGLVVDPDHRVTEKIESNNFNQGYEIDSTQIELAGFDVTNTESPTGSLYFSIAKRTFLRNTDGWAFQYDSNDIIKLDLYTENRFRFSRFFNGADHGLKRGSESIDAFSILDTGQIVISTLGDSNAGGLELVGQDLVLFTPDQGPGRINSVPGTWEMLLDGDQFGLNRSYENIDAVDVFGSGRVIISTRGGVHSNGFQAADEDMVYFNPRTNGNGKALYWSTHFDGSDVQLSNSSEDIDAFSFAGKGRFAFSTLGNGRVNEGPFQNSDAILFNATRLGGQTEGTFSMFASDAYFGLVGANISALHFGKFRSAAALNQYFQFNSGASPELNLERYDALVDRSIAISHSASTANNGVSIPAQKPEQQSVLAETSLQEASTKISDQFHSSGLAVIDSKNEERRFEVSCFELAFAELGMQLEPW